MAIVVALLCVVGFHLRLFSSIREPVSRAHGSQGVLRNDLGRSAGHAEKQGELVLRSTGLDSALAMRRKNSARTRRAVGIHAMAVVAVGAAVWYLFSIRPPESWGGSWQAKARLGLAVVSVALLVGFGRVYEGASYPSDVLAGWALGGVWASVCLTAAELFRRLRASGEDPAGKLQAPYTEG